MATNTANLNLIKPSGADKIRIAQINQNMDILDEKIGAVGNTSLQAQVTALNSQLVKDLGSKSLSDLESALVTLGNSLGTGGVAHFTVAISNSSGVFTAASYVGFVEKVTTNRLTVILSRNVVNQTVCGRYNGSWAWDEYTLNSQLSLRLFNSSNYAESATQQITFPADLIVGQAYLVIFRHYTSATTFTADAMLMSPLSGSSVAMAWIAKNSSTTLSSVSVSGRVVTFTFSATAYCSIYFIKMK